VTLGLIFQNLITIDVIVMLSLLYIKECSFGSLNTVFIIFLFIRLYSSKAEVCKLGATAFLKMLTEKCI